MSFKGVVIITIIRIIIIISVYASVKSEVKKV